MPGVRQPALVNMHRAIATSVAACVLGVTVLACQGISTNRANMNSSAPPPSPTGKLKKGNRVRVFGHNGTIIDFIPKETGDNLLAAVIRTDEEIVFENIRGNIVIMQLRYVGAEWGGGREMDRIVGAYLCANGPQYPDVPSWFKNGTCVQLDWGLGYDVL